MAEACLGDVSVMQLDLVGLTVVPQDGAEKEQLPMAETCLGDVSVMQLDLRGLMAHNLSKEMHIKSQDKKETDGAKVTKEHGQANKNDKIQEVDAATVESHQAQNLSKDMHINRQHVLRLMALN